MNSSHSTKVFRKARRDLCLGSISRLYLVLFLPDMQNELRFQGQKEVRFFKQSFEVTQSCFSKHPFVSRNLKLAFNEKYTSISLHTQF